jgi:hypothetical protein
MFEKGELQTLIKDAAAKAAAKTEAIACNEKARFA